MNSLLTNIENLVQTIENYELVSYTETIIHSGRSKSVELIKIQQIEKKKGRKNLSVSTAENFIETYNSQLIEETKKSIEETIKTEQQENNLKLSSLEETQKKALESLKNEYETKLNAYKLSKDSKEAKTTKIVVWIAVFVLFLISVVATGMNFHNLNILFNGIFHWSILLIFSICISSMLTIFAYMQSEKHTKIARVILPLDFLLTILLTLFFNEEIQNVSSFWVIATVKTLFGGAYAYQVYLITKEFSSLMLDNELRTKFFNKLFE